MVQYGITIMLLYCQTQTWALSVIVPLIEQRARYTKQLHSALRGRARQGEFHLALASARTDCSTWHVCSNQHRILWEYRSACIQGIWHSSVSQITSLTGGPQAAAGMQGHLEGDGGQALQDSGHVYTISRIYTNVQKEALAPDVLQSVY